MKSTYVTVGGRIDTWTGRLDHFVLLPVLGGGGGDLQGEMYRNVAGLGEKMVAEFGERKGLRTKRVTKEEGSQVTIRELWYFIEGRKWFWGSWKLQGEVERDATS